MIKIPNINSLLTAKIALTNAQEPLFKVGQILNGRAETSAKALDDVIIRIGEQRLQARTPIDLKAGENLKLLVKSLGDPPLLSIQGNTVEINPAVQKLKLFIQQYSNTNQAVQQLTQLASQKNLPSTVLQSLQSLLQQIPNAPSHSKNIDIKNSLQNNAVFLESQLLTKNTVDVKNNLKAQLLTIDKQINLLQSTGTPKADNNLTTLLNQFQQQQINTAQLIKYFVASLSSIQAINISSALNSISLNQPMTTTLPNDIKQALIQLVTILKTQTQGNKLVEQLTQQLLTTSALQDLKSSIDSLLNKINSQQLIPLIREPDSPILLLFSLLFKEQKELHLIDFKFEELNKKNESDTKDWLINIKFEFSSLGIIQAKVHVLDNQVSTLFEAQKPGTVTIINRFMPVLEKSLHDSGFQIMQLRVQQKNIKDEIEIPKGINILDEKA